MALLKIFTFPDPVLKEKALPVSTFDTELEKLAQNMLDTMYDAPGVGLAANQVGILQRVIVIDVDYAIEGDESTADEIRRYVDKKPLVLINPKILKKRGEVLFKEGCLSVPGYTEEVKRSKWVEIEYQDCKGTKQTLSTGELLAVAIQHELDHLDGKLFIDRLSIVKRGLIKGKIKRDHNKPFERSKFHVEL